MLTLNNESVSKLALRVVRSFLGRVRPYPLHLNSLFHLDLTHSVLSFDKGVRGDQPWFFSSGRTELTDRYVQGKAHAIDRSILLENLLMWKCIRVFDLKGKSGHWIKESERNVVLEADRLIGPPEGDGCTVWLHLRG